MRVQNNIGSWHRESTCTHSFIIIGLYQVLTRRAENTLISGAQAQYPDYFQDPFSRAKQKPFAKVGKKPLPPGPKAQARITCFWELDRNKSCLPLGVGQETVEIRTLHWSVTAGGGAGTALLPRTTHRHSLVATGIEAETPRKSHP